MEKAWNSACITGQIDCKGGKALYSLCTVLCTRCKALSELCPVADKAGKDDFIGRKVIYRVRQLNYSACKALYLL